MKRAASDVLLTAAVLVWMAVLDAPSWSLLAFGVVILLLLAD